MKTVYPYLFRRQLCAVGVSFLLGLSSSLGVVPPPFVFSGVPVENSDFIMNINQFGYSDSMLDYRVPFMGREFLSGEWAGAARYTGGTLGGMTRWLPERFVFPDYWTAAPRFTPVGGFSIDALPNMYGFPVYRSKIENADLEVSMKYETINFGLSLASRFRIGLEANGLGGPGSYLESTQYGYKQTYEFKNKTAGTLSNFRFFQFLHTLHGDWGVYDARDYGGGMSSYMYGITLQGESYGFDDTTYETVKHTDTVGMAFSHAPVGYEVGAYGMKQGGNHQTGEPAVGVHKSMDANNLSMTDSYVSDEMVPEFDAWVSAAAAFDLGSIPPGGMVSMDVILGMHTSYTVVSPPIELVVHDIKYDAGNINIDFEEKTMNPRVGFILRESATGEGSKDEWDPVGVSYQLDTPFINWRRFLFTADMESKPTLLFYVQPTIINDP